MSMEITVILAGVIAGGAPILLATLGETLSEKGGIINLSLDGTILMGAMTAFAVAYETGSVFLGFGAAAAVGGLVAALVALFSIRLGLSQVAVGFVLTLTTRDLAYFLGNSYSRIQGPQLDPMPLPILGEIPILGEVFFRHNAAVYFSMLLIAAIWWYLYRTRQGLELRSVGEHPAAAYARGLHPGRIQLLHAVAGGMMAGAAGAVFSLAAKPGWGRPQGAEGTGWIALALVIFGGWNPLKAAAGAYLFAFLQAAGISLQAQLPSVPAQVFQVAPFPLMIFTLLVLSLAQRESVRNAAAGHPRIERLMRTISGMAPAALGKSFRPD